MKRLKAHALLFPIKFFSRKGIGMISFWFDVMDTVSSSLSDKKKKKRLCWNNREPFEITSDNGYLLCDKYRVPEEVLALILSHVPPKQLVFNIRRVCKWWCNVIDSLVWRIKLQRLKLPMNKIVELPWFACFWVEYKSPLNRNLIKNNCGQDGLKFWTVITTGGDGWTVEKPPLGCSDFPAAEILTDQYNSSLLVHNSCFATSYIPCTKTQLINLKKEGLCPQLMDIVQPTISISEWCCGRFDCSSTYELHVTLLDEKKKILATFNVKNQLGAHEDSPWQKVSHVFQDYGAGVRFVEFCHSGVDARFWKGHYGSKMTGAAIIVSF